MDGTGSLFEPFVSALDPTLPIEIVRYPTSGALGYAELEAHARQFLPTSGPFVILGESFSGPVAVSLAASRPPGLVGLILCSTFVRNPQPVFGPLRILADVLPVKLAPQPMLNAFLLGRRSTPTLRMALAGALSQVSADAKRARLRAVLSVDVSTKLQAVEVPVLYLQAARDQVVPASALRHIQRVFPPVQVASFDAPHFLLQTVPAEAARAVTAFVQGLRGAS